MTEAKASGLPPRTPPGPAQPSGGSLEGALGRGRSYWRAATLWLLLGLVLLAIVMSAMTWRRVTGMREQLAMQSAKALEEATAANTLAEQWTARGDRLASEVTALQEQTRELVDYRAQMQDLVRAAVRVRDENLVAELQAALQIAQDQSRLTGRVEPLLAALHTARRRLAQASDFRLTPVSRAVLRDIDRVEQAVVPDIPGLLTRIDLALRSVDRLPLQGAAAMTAPGASGAQEATRRSGWLAWAARLTDPFRPDVIARRLRMSAPASDVNALVREHVKLRLQGARLAVLARQYEAARADLAAAADELARYFSATDSRVRSLIAELQQIRTATRETDSPGLPGADETMAALERVARGRADDGGP